MQCPTRIVVATWHSPLDLQVKVTAPFDTVVESVSAPAGTRVVEGALLLTLKPAA